MYKKYYLMYKEYFFAHSDVVWLCFNLRIRIEDRLCYTVYNKEHMKKRKKSMVMLR